MILLTRYDEINYIVDRLISIREITCFDISHYVYISPLCITTLIVIHNWSNTLFLRREGVVLRNQLAYRITFR